MTMKRKYKQRNYAYYKDRIQEYCMGNLPQDSKAPAGSRYYGRRFFSPDQCRFGSMKGRGKLSVFDSENPASGTNYNMFKDWETGKSGDIYMLVMWNEGISTRYEAYDRIEDLMGKAPEKEQSRTQAVRYRNKTARQARKEGNFKRTKEFFDNEEATCLSRRRAIEDQLISNLQESGAFFKSMDKIPCQIKIGQNGSIMQKEMTCANYLKAMILDAPDPRYMCKTDIDKAGWKLREGAKPETFEYLVNTDKKYHLVTWKLYNAKDIEGIPPYEKRQVLSREEITDRIQTVLQDNGVKMKNEALFKDPIESIKALRKLTGENTWHEARLPAQRALEREYAMTKLLQQVGATKPYKIKDGVLITEYLEHDATTKILYKSAYRSDTASRKINGSFKEAELKRVAKQARELEAMMKDPLQHLEVTMNQDYQMNDTLIPKGAQLKGDDAYKVLFHIVQEDRKLFEDIDNPEYRKNVSFKVTFGDCQQDVSLEQGLLQTGNKGTITESLKYAALRPQREQAFDESRRDAVIMERIKLKLFNGSDAFREAWETSPEMLKDAEARLMIQEYQKADMELSQAMEPLLQSESRYLSSHPAYKKIEDRVDTYLYHVPANENITNEIDVRQRYGELVIDVKYPEFYGCKEDGLVIELKRSLVPDYNGHFMAPGMEEEPLQVKPFLKDIEQHYVQDFEDKFVVSLETDYGKESYKGDEARQFAYALMQDDRDMWAHEQCGMKPVEYSGWRKITVSYDDIPILKREYYDGQMKIGEHRFLKEFINSDRDILDANGKEALRSLNKGLRVLEKYTENQMQLEAAAEFERPKKEDIEAVIQRGFEPENMEEHRPKIGRKVAQVMPWYETKAIVNYCHTSQEKTDYMVAELAKKYKADTIERWIGSYLPKYKKYVKESLARPAIKQTIENQSKRRKMQFRSQSEGRQA